LILVLIYFREDALILLTVWTSEKWSLSTATTTAAAAAIQHN